MLLLLLLLLLALLLAIASFDLLSVWSLIPVDLQLDNVQCFAAFQFLTITTCTFCACATG